MRQRLLSFAAATALLLAAAPAAATPNLQTGTGTEDDAKITLRVLTQTIDEDNKSWCEVRIEVGSSAKRFSAGDKVFLWVYEDDTLGDDIIWSTDFTVTGAEVTAQRVDRTFDCSDTFGSDSSATLEIYAQARVEKDTCGLGCLYDRPETSNLNVAVVEDDNREQNDTNTAASGLSLGNNNDLICRDQDWYTLALSSPARLTFDLSYRANTGRLDMAFFNPGLTSLGSVTDTDGGGTLIIERAEVGDYLIRVAPRASGDFNFYDLRMTVDTLAADCVTGTTEAAACGRCGTQTRTCDAQGRWGPYADCTGEGVCAPGEMTTDACGSCGSQSTTCTDQCTWGAPSACAGEGECAPETVEEIDCTGGTQMRTCDSMCVWGELTTCGEIVCTDGESEPCYSGPAGTAGVGICTAGTRRCINNAWGQCRSEILPGAEICADNLDNDCDGQRDADDTDCANTGRPLGDPCTSNADCTTGLDCIKAPQDPQFFAGYCGKAECTSDAACGAEGFCSTIFDENYCLASCTNSGDCRDEYLCADVGGRNGCIPRCRADNHCRGTAFPSCNVDSGLCEAIGGNNTPANNNPANNNPANNNPDPGNNNPDPGNNNPDPGNNNPDTETPTPATPAGDEACGCATPARPLSLASPWLLMGLVVAGGALLRRRQ